MTRTGNCTFIKLDFSVKIPCFSYFDFNDKQLVDGTRSMTRFTKYVPNRLLDKLGMLFGFVLHDNSDKNVYSRTQPRR